MAKRHKRDPNEVPELTKEWFTGATKIADGPNAMRAYVQAQRRSRGKQKAPTKEMIALRLSKPVLEAYRGTGRGWQTRINADLEKAAKRLRASR